MKKIDTTQIVDPTSLQPFTGYSLEFLQDAQAEARAGVIKALIISNRGSYSLTTPYVISGCVPSGTYDVTAGEIFYGGEFFEATALTGSLNPIQYVLTKTQDVTADPIEFTDSVMKNVHDIYKYVATDTATPQAFDTSDFVTAYGSAKTTSEVLPANLSITSSSFIDMTGATYTTPNDGVTRLWMITAQSDITKASSVYEGGAIQIYNNTTATALHTSGAYLNITTIATPFNDFYASVHVQKLVSLAPNTVIRIRHRTQNGTSTSFNNNSFIMVEI